MPPLLRFAVLRLFSFIVTLFVITALLYGVITLTPPEVRATLFIPRGLDVGRLTEDEYNDLIEKVIKKQHLRDPFPIQYAAWVVNLARGEWGYSPVMNDDVLASLLRRTPVTVELTLYSLLLFIPLGLVSGVISAHHKGRWQDNQFRITAFIATSMPVFILAIVLMAIFYVILHWFPPERMSINFTGIFNSEGYRSMTGLLTVDALLNGRTDLCLDALRHLVLPVITLSLAHWATLGRVMRALMIEEAQKEYVVAAKARGIPTKIIIWKHIFRNAVSPAITSSGLSAASLFTGISVVEIIYNFKGISEVFIYAMTGIPDAASAMGYAVYSVLVVLSVVLVLDILQIAFDPRLRAGEVAL